MLYVSADVETTGLDPNKCHLLEFAAIVADTKENIPLGKFQRLLKIPEGAYWDPFAKSMNAEWYWKAIAEDNGAIKPEKLIPAFESWLLANHVNPKDFVFAGKNFGKFDLQFINRLPGYGDLVLCNARILEPAMLYFDPMSDEQIPNMDLCSKRIGLEGYDTMTHRAFSDCERVITLLREGWKLAGCCHT